MDISHHSLLRAGLFSNSLRLVTTGMVNGLIAFSSEWAGPLARRGLCCWYFLYEIHRKFGEYFKLRCGQSPIRIRSAHGSLYEKAAFKLTSAEPPPRGNRNRAIEPSTVPARAHCPSGGAAKCHFLSSLCSPGHVGLYEILRKSRAYFKLCCGQHRIRMRSAHGSYIKYIFVILLVLFCWVLCSHAGQITDMAGQKAMVPDEIHSIFGTSPPVTAILYTMAPELVAGLNVPCRGAEKQYLPPRFQSLPVVGGWFGQGQTPNLETLLQINPDVVLLWHVKNSLISSKIENTLIPLGFPVVHISLDRLEDYPDTYRFLGRLLHREDRGEALAEYAEEMLDKINAVQDSIAKTDKVSVYYAEGIDGLSTECDTSIHAGLIPICGGKNVHMCSVRTTYGMEKVSLEQVMHYAPEVIVTSESLFYDAVFRDPRWQNIPAVQNHRVYRIPCSPFNWFDRPPSFMRLLGAEWLLNKLYPEKYSVDIVDQTRRFYNLFLNFNLDRQAAEKFLSDGTHD